MNPQLTCSQRQWFHSSVGRALHRYREITCSNPVEVLNFFQASLRNCINCVHCDDHFLIFIWFPQFIYDFFLISLTNVVVVVVSLEPRLFHKGSLFAFTMLFYHQVFWYFSCRISFIFCLNCNPFSCRTVHLFACVWIQVLKAVSPL